ncbi:MAG: hypothetical protein M1812_005601 [Candelaria pacifica]|nr:MAG: hypothetical protein M1812_005601 [Candelaria pacifica]
MISRQSPPLALYLSYSSRGSSPSKSTFSDCDADDEGTMSAEESTSSKPLMVAIPHGPYYPRQPTLAEVLSNKAPPPWSLTAFMAYLSQNHCLETLEFTMDASRYRKHFNKMAARNIGTPVTTESQEPAYVRMLWQRLLEAYIVPNGPREVNLPGDVRDQLLSLPNTLAPPSPDSLDPAVKIIYELMDDSVLIPFLNSVSRLPGPQTTSLPYNTSDDNIYMHSLQERGNQRPRSRRQTPSSSVDFVSSSYSGTGYSTRTAQSSHFNLSHGLEMRASPSDDYMTDGSGGASSPGHEPMTPPSTPPTSDIGGNSPKSRNDGTWKKMTGKLGWKKRSTGTLRDHSRYLSYEEDEDSL